ncbi:Xaa-Pro dipeptidase [Hyphomicrobiales bacterium]|nr:Xaa-Pro dipeptidase [Hyphomicrobiales bacterium]
MSVVPEADTAHRAFPTAEYEARIAKVRGEMRARGADVLLVDCVEHMAYLFGYVPPAAIYQPALLPLDGDPVVIVRTLDAPTFTEQSWVKDYVSFGDDEDPVAILTAVVQKRGWAGRSIAVEFDSHFLPVGRFRAIESALPNARFIDFSKVIWEIRLIKSEREIAYLREASRIADAALIASINAAAPGVSERECAAVLYATALREGADNGRSALLAAGKRTDSLHGRLGDHRFETGDILHVESIPLVRGYGARIMRSTVLGEPEPDLARAASILLAAQQAQFEAMKPGAPARDVDGILRRAVLDSGLRETYTNFTGYTLGYIGLPKTSDFTRAFLPQSDWTLEAGMVFHMYTYAQGLAFSDTILVTPAGAERLTKSDRRLFVR